ncbi:MAG: KamA family radical SAM protein [Bdellovibrionales bacterium]|nr:KamA family radical SAM protein [Bdellovibrionales bacterium]
MAFYFPSVKIPDNVAKQDWFNWKWQLRHSLKTKEDYEKYFTLSTEEKKGFYTKKNSFAIQTTPYYAQVAKAKTSLRKIITPDLREGHIGKQALKDPLGEENHSPLKHVIHRYPDRVVFLVTDLCPIYCRYCTRKRFTATNKHIIQTQEYKKALEYIKQNVGIREVILSGGDPLTLGDFLLEKILKDLRTIPHVEIIRIGSRMPAVCPMRFSDSLTNMIKKYQPVFIMSHFNHPDEITLEAAKALTTLADQGIPVYNQMVLINFVNNHPAIVQALSRRLLFLRARPYYMFQCDPSLGTDHLRTSIKNSQWIQKSLWGVLSGLAVPRLAVDLPGGGGKVELVPDSRVAINKQSQTFKGWDGMTATYIDPAESDIQIPSEIKSYLKEWQLLVRQTYGDNS